MNNCDGVLYVGSGLDFSTLEIFNNTPFFVYIDSLPFVYNRGGKYSYIGKFITNLIESMIHLDFEMVFQSDNLIMFESDNRRQILKYYIGCNYPTCISDEIIRDTLQCNILFIKGYIPRENILNIMCDDIIVVGSVSTYLGIEESEYEDDVIQYLWYNPDSVKFYYLSMHDNTLVQFRNIQEMERYQNSIFNETEDY